MDAGSILGAPIWYSGSGSRVDELESRFWRPAIVDALPKKASFFSRVWNGIVEDVISSPKIPHDLFALKNTHQESYRCRDGDKGAWSKIGDPVLSLDQFLWASHSQEITNSTANHRGTFPKRTWHIDPQGRSSCQAAKSRQGGCEVPGLPRVETLLRVSQACQDPSNNLCLVAPKALGERWRK